MFFKTSQNSQENTYVRVSRLIKLQASEFDTQTLKNTIFVERLQATASDYKETIFQKSRLFQALPAPAEKFYPTNDFTQLTIFPNEWFHPMNVPIVSKAQQKWTNFPLFMILNFEEGKRCRSERIHSDAKINRDFMSI